MSSAHSGHMWWGALHCHCPGLKPEGEGGAAGFRSVVSSRGCPFIEHFVLFLPGRFPSDQCLVFALLLPLGWGGPLVSPSFLVMHPMSILTHFYTHNDFNKLLSYQSRLETRPSHKPACLSRINAIEPA